jgi:hypothetical protein
MIAPATADGLPADHARHARGTGDEGHRRQLPRRQRTVPIVDGLPGEQAEGLGEQAVAGENRHALAELHVRRRSPAPHRVVVHRRQIVVDERVGVDQLDGTRGRERQPVRFGVAGRHRFCRRQSEQRPQPLPAGLQAVAQRDVEHRGAVGRCGERCRERLLDEPSAGFDPRREDNGRAHRGSASPASDAPAGFTSPRSVRISMRRSASSSRA